MGIFFSFLFLFYSQLLIFIGVHVFCSAKGLDKKVTKKSRKNNVVVTRELLFVTGS